MSVQVRVMGSLEIESEAGRVGSSDFPSRKARQVVELLALAKGRTVTKDTLLDTLWRRGLPRNPTATVEVAVSLMRTTLARITDARVVVTEPGGYRLDLELVDIDLVSFDELTARASGRPDDERIVPLRAALALARGPLLEDEVGAEWLQVQRDRHHRQVEAAQLSLARAALAQGDAELAFTAAEAAWMASDLVLEEAYEVGVAALVQLERVSEARALHAGALRRVTTEDGRPPSPALEAAAALFQPSPRRRLARATVVVDPSLVGAPWPLPFLGRSAELARIDGAIAGALAGESTVIGVVGPPGIGRSRLLTEVSERHRQAGRSAPVHVLQCRPSDRELPMMAASRLLRSIASAAGRASPSLEDAPTALFGRFAGLLDSIGPVVLVVDDLRLADPMSASLLLSLASPGGAGRLALVVEHRTEAAFAEGPDWAVDHEVVLGPLKADELEPLAAVAAWTETAGCPWVLAVACAAAAGSGEITDEQAQSLLAPVEALGPGVLQLMIAASGHGTDFDPAALADSGQLASDVVADALGRATAAGIVRQVGDDQFEFTAELLHRVLVSTTRAAR